MSLDVFLYQFKDLDTDAILKLWKLSEEPWVYYLAQLAVMIETLDFVLNSGNPREFLLYWSD